MVHYYSKDRERGTKQKTDPFKNAWFMVLALAVVLLLANFFVEDAFKKTWWVLPIIFILILLLYMTFLRKKNPLSFKEQYDITNNLLADTYYAREPKGDLNLDKIDGYSTSQEQNRENLGNWILSRKITNIKKDFFVQIDKLNDGEITRLIPNPPSFIKEWVMGVQLSQKPFTITEEFTYGTEAKEEAVKVREQTQTKPQREV